MTKLADAGDPQVAALVGQFGAAPVVDLIRGGLRGGAWSGWSEQAIAQIDPAADLEQAERQGIRFIIPADEEWPQQLAALDQCSPQHDRGGVPLGLWIKGDQPLAEVTRAAVTVDGSRSASPYGAEHARSISADLSAQQMTIVSGAAFGIDQSAHRGALAAEGLTVAVLACGVDRAYPAAHADLLATIGQRGLIVSECAPGTTPSRTRFLARSRITAALSEGTVVVEAAQRSGALNTARWSNELHRPVMGVPGPVSSITSEGVHGLVRAGQATMVTSAEDIIEDLGARPMASGAELDADSHRTRRGRPLVQRPIPGLKENRQPPSR
ncbi:DNA-processing protein DprA [Brevibacterium sp. Mu109]|uniref:DNA-processing protein DprA n=1 Tax=Brevibacterium sp. Mu109 TaxID=1255669 RepID=UPI0015E06265|nr:DNA-processing protein DprA [Brevibacterium sp. Mu109]